MNSRVFLPPELWTNIVRLLPSADQRTCLFVSRFYHYLSIQFLFSTVEVYFASTFILRFIGGSISEEVVRLLLLRSWELLDHISRDPHFARVIRKVIVHAHADGEIIFERRSLIKALQCVPSLCAFNWFGTSPALPQDVAEALVKFNPKLQELKIPGCLPSYANCVTSLHHIKTLSYDTPEGLVAEYDPDNISIDGVEMDIAGLVDANSATLRQISLSGRLVWNLPIPVFSNLTEVTISGPAKFDNLGLLLHHATSLESLLFVGLTDAEIFPALLDNAHTPMPRLASLKVSSMYVRHSEQCFVALYEFLRRKPALRRLDVDLSGNWSSVSILFPIFQSIEVLGIHVGYPPDEGYDFAPLVQHLSADLTAARFHFLPNIVDGVATGWTSNLTDRLAQLPSLRFLILNTGYLEGNLPLKVENVVIDMARLETVGLHGQMYSVSRAESSIRLSQWSDHKMEMAMIEHFPCEDEQWLMRNVERRKLAKVHTFNVGSLHTCTLV